jgi:hypothetical protein
MKQEKLPSYPLQLGSGVPDWIHSIRCQHIDTLPDV